MKKSSEKSFGLLFFVVLFVVGLYPLLSLQSPRIWSLVLALIFLILALLKPNFLKPLNLLWIKFGELLGRIIAPIVMCAIFFLVVTPLSFLAKLFGKDFLNIKLKKDKNTYWIKRKNNVTTMKKQF